MRGIRPSLPGRLALLCAAVLALFSVAGVIADGGAFALHQSYHANQRVSAPGDAAVLDAQESACGLCFVLGAPALRTEAAPTSIADQDSVPLPLHPPAGPPASASFLPAAARAPPAVS